MVILSHCMRFSSHFGIFWVECSCADVVTMAPKPEWQEHWAAHSSGRRLNFQRDVAMHANEEVGSYPEVDEPTATTYDQKEHEQRCLARWGAVARRHTGSSCADISPGLPPGSLELRLGIELCARSASDDDVGPPSGGSLSSIYTGSELSVVRM